MRCSMLLSFVTTLNLSSTICSMHFHQLQSATFDKSLDFFNYRVEQLKWLHQFYKNWRSCGIVKASGDSGNMHRQDKGGFCWPYQALQNMYAQRQTKSYYPYYKVLLICRLNILYIMHLVLLIFLSDTLVWQTNL